MTAPRRFYDAAQEARSAHHRRNLRAAQLGYGPLPRGRRIHSATMRALPRPPRPPFPPARHRPHWAWQRLARDQADAQVENGRRRRSAGSPSASSTLSTEKPSLEVFGSSESRIREEYAADRHPKAAADQVAFFVQHLEGIRVARISERGVDFHHAPRDPGPKWLAENSPVALAPSSVTAERSVAIPTCSPAWS